MKEPILELKKTPRLLFDGVMIGLFSGGLAAFYRYLISRVDDWRAWIYQDRTFLQICIILFCAILIGLFVSYLLKWAPLSGGSGIPQVQGELSGIFSTNGWKVTVSKMMGGALTSLVGLTLGREGPSIQLGASSAKTLANSTHRSFTEERLFMTAGAAAGLAAAFSAPISGLILILEEFHKNMSKTVIAISFTAAVVADFVAGYIFKLEPIFKFGIQQVLPLKYYGYLIPLTLVTACVGVFFNHAILLGQDLIKKSPLKESYKIPFVFLLIACIGFLSPHLLGGGHHLIEGLAKSSNSLGILLGILIIRFLLTSVCYGTGVQGGIFLPLLVIGGIVGIIYYNFLEELGLLEGSFLPNFVILSMTAMLTATVRSPILSVVLILELNGNMNHMLELCFVSVASFFVAEILKSTPIYESLLGRLIQRTAKRKNFKNERTVFEISVPMNSAVCKKAIKELELPPHSLIIEVDRMGVPFIPKGNDIIEAGDILQILTTDDNFHEIRSTFMKIFGEDYGS